MSARISKGLYSGTASLALLTGALFWSGSAVAQQVAQAGRTGDVETVIITGTAFNTDIAPAKASLDTMEPQTIINKSYIQDSVANTADYTTILAIAPSMSGQDINGPGLSDGNVKNTLRGMPDGNFTMTWDGIPFGDTNGPTHHSESYFPGVVIGTIDVNRGPGNAGTIGAATFGGQVNMFSEALTADRHLSAYALYGSWNTESVNANIQTGDFDVAGLNNKALINLNYVGSYGYLTDQNTNRQNYLIKTQTDLPGGWTLTAFANYSNLDQHLNDSNGATAAQINTYGENFALQSTNPNLATYQNYNPEHKKTDMEYLRLQGKIGDISIDDTSYTYAYVNKTISSTNIQQTQADINAGVTEGMGTIVNGIKHPGDVPGYTKQNAYRVWGNVLRASDDFDFGWLTGQVRAGVWWEGQATQRQRFDYDLTMCMANNCDPWHSQQYADSSLSPKSSSAQRGGFAEYIEHSNWNQYQPFIEVDLHPIDGLTITPGFKYIDWQRSVAAPIEQKVQPLAFNFSASNTTTHDLPFVEANYKLEPNWSIYFEYAQGIYIPDISEFEQKTGPTNPASIPKPETTTNYQFGTVYYADNWTFDGDVYYIGVNNNIVEGACTATGQFAGPIGETCAVNTGVATYKGVEGEGTYAFNDDVLGGALNGMSVFASGSLNDSKSGGFWIKQAPMWTEATGIIYKIDAFKFSMIDKLVGQQYSDSTNTTFYKLGAYNNMDLKGSYTFDNYEFTMGVYNALNQRNLLAVTINDKNPIGGTNVYNIAARGGSLDQYYYAPSTSFQFSVTARF
ncbi:MAG TPA: TonB-dependent receptor [Rhizomicrobium sp.]|jgi:iron complex outermembrane receptor protein|nr:TonB-dependent receptor [Rhizomicrobium sp.]